MIRLFIAEKPSMGRAIASALDMSGNGSHTGDGCIYVGNDIVTWLFGHLLEQYSPDDYDEKYKKWNIEDLPILPSVWKSKVKKSAAKQCKIVTRLAKEADVIVNAGDPDREGQLLVDELLNYIGVLKSKKVDRILLNALDVKSIRAALKEIRPNNDFVGLRNSALARARADWLIGMNLSRIYTILAKNAGYENVVSVGRVKTPTMGLVVRREIEICKFQSKKFYTPEIILHHANGDFSAKWKKDERDGVDEEGRIVRKEIAEAIFSNANRAKNALIVKLEEKRGESKQRLPYSLSTLQVEAGKQTGFSPQKILDLQQSLYEKKLTSYPRSDCTYLPENQFSDAKEILIHLASQNDEFAQFAKEADVTIKSPAWNDKKISAHHAIIPTTVKANLEELSNDERRLYRMIAKAYIAQFYPTQEFEATHVEVCCGEETFIANGKVILRDGWKRLFSNIAGDKKEDSADGGKLPKMQEGDSCEICDTKLVEGITKPPSRFTGATLIQAMKEIHKYVHDKSLAKQLKECAGIGTEATRAGIIEELEKKGLIEKKGKYFIPTEVSSVICRILPEELIYPDLTARWEDALDKIEKKEISVEDFQREQQDFLNILLGSAKEANIPHPKNATLCPSCHSTLTRRKSKKGTYFWSCNNQDCKKLFGDERGKVGKEWIFKN